MHKRIRLVENIAHMAEHKYASINFPSLYFDVKRRADSLKFAHDHFKSEFMKRSNVEVTYFIPDPINGVIQTQGPKSRESSRIFLFQHLSSIFLPQPYILLESVVNVTFVNPRVCEKFSAVAFTCVMCDLGNYSNITANTHSLFCHASTFIQWAQMELGVSLGALTENSIEKGN